MRCYLFCGREHFFIHFMCPIFSGSDYLLCGTQLVQQFFKSFFRRRVSPFSFTLFSHALIPSIRVSLVINYYIHQHHRLSNETSLLPSSVVNYSLRAKQSTLFIIVEILYSIVLFLWIYNEVIIGQEKYFHYLNKRERANFVRVSDLVCLWNNHSYRLKASSCCA